jgi:hypothetical protein
LLFFFCLIGFLLLLFRWNCWIHIFPTSSTLAKRWNCCKLCPRTRALSSLTMFVLQLFFSLFFFFFFFWSHSSFRAVWTSHNWNTRTWMICWFFPFSVRIW